MVLKSYMTPCDLMGNPVWAKRICVSRFVICGSVCKSSRNRGLKSHSSARQEQTSGCQTAAPQDGHRCWGSRGMRMLPSLQEGPRTPKTKQNKKKPCFKPEPSEKFNDMELKDTLLHLLLDRTASFPTQNFEQKVERSLP